MRCRGVRLSVVALALILAAVAPSLEAGSRKSSAERKVSRQRPGTRPALEARAAAPFSRADETEAQIAVRWFDLLYKAIATERLSPPPASRVIGYAGVALHEAVVPATPGGRSLAGQLNALPPLPQPQAHKKYHWPTVANVAVADTLRGLLPAASQPTKDAIDALEAQLASEMPPPLPPPVRERSEELGSDLAQAILAWAAGDGLTTYNNCAFTPPTGDGMWVPVPPSTAGPLQPCWGQIRPFVLHDGGECAPDPHPPYSTDPGSDFYAEGHEVYQTGNTLTDEQKAIARFWADGAGTGTPPGHWISVTGQIVTQRHLSLAAAARAYAGVGMAVADSFIACWETKFTYNLLRPITYIQANIDAQWSPFIGTPPFPEYTSGHSVQSAAAADVLTALLGIVPFTDRTHDAAGLPPRSFGSFDEAAEEAAISRLYGGIHYRAAIESGMEQGECIAGRILDRADLGQ